MMTSLVATLLVLVHCTILVCGARILAMLPLFARSHHQFHRPVLKALARAGHEVVVYSPFPLDHPVPNYTDVALDAGSFNLDLMNSLALKHTEAPYFKCLDLLAELGTVLLNDLERNKNVNNLLNSNEHFDLIITEALTSLELTLIFGERFKAPVFALQAFATNNVVNSNFGNALSLSYIPDVCTPFSNKMSFLERIKNTLYSLRNLYYVYYLNYIPMVEATLLTQFPNYPPLPMMMGNISLIFVNDHLTADYAQPRTPNIIPVGGIHIEDESPLPKNITIFMDNAVEGVILFSLGTYVPDDLQPKEYFDMFIRVFSQLKQRVLWKTRKEDIQGLPDNVMTLKWTPQRDILAHPKMVLFITHGGLLSQLETIHCGVPVVVIPQFFDQHRNARFYEEKGVGVTVNIQDLTEATILAAIRTVLGNPQYADNMRRLSRVFRDRPMSPAETVVFWTEHVLRYGGSHLRPASTQLAWYQLALLDVLAFLLILVVLVCLIVYYICRKIYSYCKPGFLN